MRNPDTWSLAITALGGALGALLLRSVVKLVAALCARRTPLAVYGCATADESSPGNLRHSWGHSVADSKTRSGNAWEYTSTPIRRPSEAVTGEHTIFGPYLNDFGRPGFYRVSYRLSGDGFPPTEEPVISLDVVQARFGTEQVLRLLGQKIIRAKELSDEYQTFDIVCHAPGTGVYEYRCAVLPKGVHWDNRTIRFDLITVYSHPSLWEAL